MDEAGQAGDDQDPRKDEADDHPARKALRGNRRRRPQRMLPAVPSRARRPRPRPRRRHRRGSRPPGRRGGGLRVGRRLRRGWGWRWIGGRRRQGLRGRQGGREIRRGRDRRSRDRDRRPGDGSAQVRGGRAVPRGCESGCGETGGRRRHRQAPQERTSHGLHLSDPPPSKPGPVKLDGCRTRSSWFGTARPTGARTCATRAAPTSRSPRRDGTRPSGWGARSVAGASRSC